MPKNDFTWWQNALAGTRGPISADDPEPGFYENRRKDRRTGDITRQTVAYWHDSQTGELRCHRDGRDVADLDAREMWPYASRRPIAEEVYYAVRNGKSWPDTAVQASPEEGGAELTEAEKIVADIQKQRGELAKYAKIESDEQAGLAQSLRSEFTRLAGKLDKEREALVRPHIDAQREVNGKWNPIITAAKADANTIRKALEDWEDFKRDQQRKAEEAARKTDELARREADWQAAAPAGSIPDPSLLPAPAPVRSNAPAPVAQIKGGTGRAAKVEEWNEVVIDDEDKVFAHLKGAPELSALLLTLAQKATDAGLPVPGTHTVPRTRVK